MTVGTKRGGGLTQQPHLRILAVALAAVWLATNVPVTANAQNYQSGPPQPIFPSIGADQPSYPGDIFGGAADNPTAPMPPCGMNGLEAQAWAGPAGNSLLGMIGRLANRGCGIGRPVNGPPPPPSPPEKLPRTDPSGLPIRYTLTGLGTGNVKATTATAIGSPFYDSRELRSNILQRQSGSDRSFRPYEDFIDRILGGYGQNHLEYKWLGSNLSGGERIRPGAIGNVDVPGTNALDTASKKHDIQRWLSENFEVGTEVTINMSDDSIPHSYVVSATPGIDAAVARDVCASSQGRGQACERLWQHFGH